MESPLQLAITLSYSDYNVAILCALDKELLAVRALFDEEHEDISTAQEDTNHYSLGRIGRHNVVSACLPAGEYGTSPASDVVQNMRRTFPLVEFCLLVGIGGGLPSKENDIRLGDVVVSHPNGKHPAVVQHDRGKILENGEFSNTGTLQPPPRLLMKAISKLKSSPNPERISLQGSLATIGRQRPAYRFPGQDKDVLFAQDSLHILDGSDCQGCTGEVTRVKRDTDQPEIHYGPIASGNQVIKSSEQRESLWLKHGVLCCEMEAAGAMSIMPCLVIRGICDYSDSHKNKIWQEYAAATAAAAPPIVSQRSIQIPRAQPENNNPMAEQTQGANDTEMTDPDIATTSTRPSFSVSELSQALRPSHDPKHVLQKQVLFSKRRPTWNPWPNDFRAIRLFKSLSVWISTMESPLLTIHAPPACSSSELPVPEDIACHIIQYLRNKEQQNVMSLFSSYPGARSVPQNEALKILIVQTLEILPVVDLPDQNTTFDPTKADENLVDILQSCLSLLQQYFIVIEMKDPGLAELLNSIIHRAMHDPGSNFKALIISYNMKQKDKGALIETAVIPPVKLRGSLTGWDPCWNRVHPCFNQSKPTSS